MAPLLDEKKINERLDAVEDLLNNFEIADTFQKYMKSMPDLGRTISKIYNLSNKTKMSAVHLEDFAKNRLKDFLKLLDDLERIEKFMNQFTKKFGERFESKRLMQLTTFKDVNIEAFQLKESMNDKKKSPASQGLFPRIDQIIADLRGMIVLNEDTPVPAQGVNSEADTVMEKINYCKDVLDGFIMDQRKILGYKFLKYVHTKQRYELEVPTEILTEATRPIDWVITSKKKGVLRFHTP